MIENIFISTHTAPVSFSVFTFFNTHMHCHYRYGQKRVQVLAPLQSVLVELELLHFFSRIQFWALTKLL